MKISLNVALDSCDPDLTLGIMRSFLDALSDVTVIGTAAHKKCSRKEPLNIQLALCRPPDADSLPESSLWHEVIPCIALTDKNLTAVQSQIEEGQHWLETLKAELDGNSEAFRSRYWNEWADKLTGYSMEIASQSEDGDSAERWIVAASPETCQGVDSLIRGRIDKGCAVQGEVKFIALGTDPGCLEEAEEIYMQLLSLFTSHLTGSDAVGVLRLPASSIFSRSAHSIACKMSARSLDANLLPINLLRTSAGVSNPTAQDKAKGDLEPNKDFVLIAEKRLRVSGICQSLLIGKHNIGREN